MLLKSFLFDVFFPSPMKPGKMASIFLCRALRKKLARRHWYFLLLHRVSPYP